MNKNFTARIVTKEGVIYESYPKKTFGGAKRWIKRMIEEDCPSILNAGIFSIKIIHKPTHTFVAGHYSPNKKDLHIWRPYTAFRL